ncbi:hypothetical protein J7F02_20940 [Streptomyces sp. ISL-112]|uniref:hypothetical protein n=1 Tax=unclassified Streptomyces TaxID=2593676 RepID=UPI001BEBF073|nr:MULTISPECIES: hypothetical protein [unclassified Streptomyces]MBT2428052.1 hypothetical protein [Streptomyces sp. ISL-112]MBT2463153.1 hypothetical protein [Streptomyces sp. ISL-63]
MPETTPFCGWCGSGGRTFGPGGFVLPPAGRRNRFEANIEDARTSTWYAPHAYGGRTLNVEVPQGTDERSADPTPLDNGPEALLLACALEGPGEEKERLRSRATGPAHRWCDEFATSSPCIPFPSRSRSRTGGPPCRRRRGSPHRAA